MANPRQFDFEDIVNRPGTYFNPQTEVLVIIDDSPDVDTEIFNMENFEGADSVLISDETPLAGAVPATTAAPPAAAEGTFKRGTAGGADWVLIPDDTPIDGDARDELMQAFQVR